MTDLREADIDYLEINNRDKEKELAERRWSAFSHDTTKIIGWWLVPNIELLGKFAFRTKYISSSKWNLSGADVPSNFQNPAKASRT